MSAILNPRDILMQGTPVRLLPIGLPPNVVIPGIGELEPNLDAPPMPTGFSAVASLTFLNLLTGAPVFTQGHGYARTKVYGKVRTTGALPVFADSVNITSFVGQVFSHPTQPGLTWHLWVTWVSKDGIESAPAGGINGQVATTSQDVEKLVAAMTGPGNPFQVVSTPITLADGTVVPVGTYTSNAYMSTFVAGRGNIGLLAVDDARIASLAVNKLTAGSLRVGTFIASTDWNFDYGPAGLGWAIASDNAWFNNVNLRGNINGGAFIGYGWPATGLGGFHLSNNGLLLGNFNGGLYWQFGANGALNSTYLNVDGAGARFSGSLQAATGTFAGSLSAATGTFSGNLNAAGGSFSGTLSAGFAQVGTLNIGDDAVTVPRAASGLTVASVTMNVMAGKPVYLHGYSAGYTSTAQTANGLSYVGLQVNGTWVQQDVVKITGSTDDPYVPGIIESASILFVHYPPTSGAYTYSFTGAGGPAGGGAFIFAMQAKK